MLLGKQDESFYHEQFPITFKPAERFVRLEILDSVKHLDIVRSQAAFEIIKEWSKDVIKGTNSIILDGIDTISDGMYIMQVENKNIYLQQKLYMLK